MYRILYVSTPDKDLTITEVEEIVAKSRVNNRKNKITGFLCGSSKFFIQCIEGDQSDIDHLFDIIRQDKRHHHVTLLYRGAADGRRFGNWDMGVALHIDRHEDIICQYHDQSDFDPYSLNPEKALDMLMDFSRLKSYSDHQ